MDSRKIAKSVAYGLNPLVAAAFTFVTLLLSKRPQNLLILICITLMFGTFVPLASLYYLLRKKMIPDIYVSDRERRVVPFLCALSSYLLGVMALLVVGAPQIITAVMLSYFGNSLVMMMIGLRWKISIHTSGITGPATALTYALGIWWLLFLAVAVPVGWARIKMKAHTTAQVTAGALLTVATTWLQLQIYSGLLLSL